MLSNGVDIIEISRVRRVYERHPERFLRHVFTDQEVAYCRGRLPEPAVRFAGKEAISKTLGTGLRGIRWREMEILPDRRGKPLVFLHGGAQERAAAIHLTRWAVSLTHGRDLALAFVVASGDLDAVLEEER